MARKSKKTNACKRACNFIQLYARLLESDENGYGYCCSCGKMTPWGESNGGHFQPKCRHYCAAAFEEENVHLQCVTCNTHLGGNIAGYTQYMETKYSAEVIEHIKQQAYKILEKEEVQEIARIYRRKCVELAKDKNFKIKVNT